MKKLFVLVAVLFVSSTMFAQTCVEDAWQCLRQNQAPKAKKFIETCMEAYPDNAQVWLMKANVYVKLYDSDQKKKSADPNYTPRYPDALTIANEAFVKALELDPKVQPKTGMLGAQEGQRLCAQPFYEMGVAAKQKGDNPKAIENFTIAAKNFELAKASTNAALSYMQLAFIYRDDMKDNENAAAMFTKATNSKKDYTNAYIELYYTYQAMNDTARCTEVIGKALKHIPTNQINSKGFLEAQMSCYSMSNQNEKLMALCDTAIALYADDENMIASSANYLSNAKSFEKAEQILTAALEKKPTSFRLNQEMGYLYYQKMYSMEDQAAALIKEKKYNEAIALRGSDEMKAVIQKSYDWCQKAYEIDPDNLDNNRHLRETMLKLGMQVPQELNDKINARMH